MNTDDPWLLSRLLSATKSLQFSWKDVMEYINEGITSDIQICFMAVGDRYRQNAVLNISTKDLSILFSAL